MNVETVSDKTSLIQDIIEILQIRKIYRPCVSEVQIRRTPASNTTRRRSIDEKMELSS